MTEAAQSLSFRDIPKALLRYRPLQVLVALAALIEIYNLAVITSYTSTQKAREVRAVAENAIVRQQAEADFVAAKALNETEVARNAERRQAAEARKATVVADKTRYEAAVAKATAHYAEMQAKAEAEAQELQADLVNQQEQIQSQRNSYVARRKYVEAEQAEADARISQGVSGAAGVAVPRTAGYFAQECNDKFEALWADYQSFPRVQWEAERFGARLQLHKARCGFTEAQSQRLRKAQHAAVEKSFCQSPASYQKEKLQETTGALGHSPNCRGYAESSNQPLSVGSTPQNGATFRVKSEVSDGKLNLRDGPGMRHGIVVELPIGALLRQIGTCVRSDDGATRDPWCEVDWNGTKGWASSSGLERVQDANSANGR